MSDPLQILVKGSGAICFYSIAVFRYGGGPHAVFIIEISMQILLIDAAYSIARATGFGSPAAGRLVVRFCG